MNRFMHIVASIALAGSASAIEVTTTPGQLAAQLRDMDLTELTVAGEMDARDFHFIATQLTQLISLDLHGVTIVAYRDPAHPLTAGIYDFEAGTLPQSMLMGMRLESVTLPDSLRAIGYAALAGCDRLTTLDIPSSVSVIGDFALSGSGLRSVTIPATVLSVGKGALAHCFSLSDAVVNARQIGDYAFLGDTALHALQLGAEVSRIGVEAFHGTGLTALDASASTRLDSLGAWALAATPLATLSLPAQMTTMGEGAFFGTSQLSLAQLPAALTAVPDYAFAGGSRVEGDTLLRKGVTSIGDYAFYNWGRTRYFFIPASVSYIGTRAMAGMTGLEQVDIDALQAPRLGDSVWAGVNQPLVNLGTAGNEIADFYAAADQWREFHILRDYLLGDVNGDGEVDVTDINLMINYILGREVEPFIFVAADMDANATVDVTDINTVINIVLGQIEQTHVRRIQGTRRSSSLMTDDPVTIDAFSIRPGETRTLEVRLANSRNYAAMQFDITLPEGLEMMSGVEGTTRSARHSQLMRTHALTSRLVSFSMQGHDYANNDDAIVRIRVKSVDDLAPGATIDISNVLLVQNDGKGFHAPGASVPVGAATGVDNLLAGSGRAYAQGRTLFIEVPENTTAQVVSVNGVSRVLQVPSGTSGWDDFAPGFYVVLLNGNSYKLSLQ